MISHAFSFGGGVQSTACLVLAATGRLPEYRHFVMADVGADSENPATIDYVEKVAKPYAESHGIRLVVIPAKETLLERLRKKTKSSIPRMGIPTRLPSGAPGARNCTVDFKVKPLTRWTKKNGATADRPAVVGIGISTDEASRMRISQHVWQILDYPLIRLGISRDKCKAIIDEAGLPIAPRSSCWFCPLHSLRHWMEIKRTKPEQFKQSCLLEESLNNRLAAAGKDLQWFSSRLKPLREAIGDDKNLRLFADEEWEYSCGPYVCAGK